MLIRSLTLLVVLAAAFPSLAGAAPPGEVKFNRDLRGIMSDTCFKCHGPGTREAELRLDIREEALKETASGVTPIVPGKAEKSEIIRRIFSTNADAIMPPPKAHKELTPEQKELFKRWVEQGAKYEKHWSFEPIRRSPLPAAASPLARNPIDRFIAERLAEEGLAPAPEASREILIRRVAFALTGLPPTVAEVDAFLADSAPDAYEQMVDRYLASPRYGEEMARGWLDVARYADTHGLHLDNERQMWAYRDWVVNAFNRNQPFDQFTLEQLAGDLLENPATSQLVATGFIRCNVTTSEGGSINEEWIFRNAVERASTTAEAWLGLTAGCAMCHDHKFDPISQKEFYSLYAFFHSAADPPLDGNALLTAPTVRLEMPAQKAVIDELAGKIAAVEKSLEQKGATVAYNDPAMATPRPAPTETEVVWFDDEFPAGAKVQGGPGQATAFVMAEQGEPVFSGKKALKRVDRGLSQDYYEGNAAPLEVPPAGRIFAYTWLDPKDLPKAIMLQYHKGGWLHRAMWGDYEAIPWGAPGTTQKVHMGPLPEAGKWVRLEIPCEKVGLNSGDKITGFAFTQFGGTVYWDRSGILGRGDPASDPQRSLSVWWKQQTGKDTPGAPGDLNKLIKEGPEKKLKPEQEKRIRDFYVANVCVDTRAPFQELSKELANLKKQRTDSENAIPATFIFRDLPNPRDSFVMKRGQYDKPGDKVEPGTLAALPPLAKASGRANRLDLAKWLVAPENPLPARVTVNRFWQQFFGTGLVKTSFDFGSQGEPPSHPELLDWLADTYRAEGWNTKALVRLMVTSHTFRQASAAAPEQWKRDPANRLYARGPRFRLDAEQVRDNALFVSNLMTHPMGGKGTRPYQPPRIWEPVGFVGSNTQNYTQDTGAALYRRSLYVFVKRTAPPPFMVNFDAPNREAFCTLRERSNTPLQALQLLNDVQHFEAARAFAERMLREGGPTPVERLTFAYRTLLSRKPDTEEIAVLGVQLQKHLARYQADVDAAKKSLAVGESKPAAGLNEAELAAYTLVANTLLNLDETLTRN